VEPLLSTFVDCSGASSLSKNCKAVGWQKEEEKKVRIDIGYNIINLLCMCVYPHIKLPCRIGHWRCRQQEGRQRQRRRQQQQRQQQRSQISAASRAGAAGCTAHARRSPPRPAVAPAAAAAAAANVDQLAADFACAELDLLSFNSLSAMDGHDRPLKN
jgi:hypothetical protein